MAMAANCSRHSVEMDLQCASPDRYRGRKTCSWTRLAWSGNSEVLGRSVYRRSGGGLGERQGRNYTTNEARSLTEPIEPNASRHHNAGVNGPPVALAWTRARGLSPQRILGVNLIQTPAFNRQFSTEETACLPAAWGNAGGARKGVFERQICMRPRKD